MLVEIPPSMSVSSFVGYLKGKSTLMIFERHANLKYKYGNRHFWCRGYYVDTVGKNAKKIQEYIQNQLKEDFEYDQMTLSEYIDPFTGEPVKPKEGIIVHSDQGSQYTSKAFIEFCKSVHVTQSMSKAGYPYDNAPMERYFNTLKNECTNLYEFTTEEALYQKVEEFAYIDYNHIRPHSFNGYRTPYEARMTT